MLTVKEAFKVGFMLRCADAGMTGEQASDCAQKAASLLTKKAYIGQSVVDNLPGAAVGLGLALPVMAGAGVGYLASEAATPEVDADDVKKRELIDEFRHYARRARERQQNKVLRQI